MIQKPTKAHFDLEKRISTLYFKDNEQADYMMRGGICCPTHVEIDGKADHYGFAVMAGYNTETGLVKIFEQQKFVVIDNVLRSDKSIEFSGLAPWFNHNWTKYFASDYFWNQDFELAKRYRLEVLRSEMIKPKPQFIEIDWSDVEEARHIIWKYVKLAKMRIEQDSFLFQELQHIKKGEKQTLPAELALMCCLSGIERFPWRKTA